MIERPIPTQLVLQLHRLGEQVQVGKGDPGPAKGLRQAFVGGSCGGKRLSGPSTATGHPAHGGARWPHQTLADRGLGLVRTAHALIL